MKKLIYFFVTTVLSAAVLSGGIVGQAAAESQSDVVVEINADSSEYSSGQKADIGYKVYSNIMDPGIEVRNVYITASADEKLSEVGVEGGTKKIDMLEFGAPAESSAAVKSGDSEEPQFTLTENNSAEASYSETEEKGTPVWIFWLAVASAAAVLAAVIAFKKKRAKASFMLAAIIFCASASAGTPAIKAISGTDNRVTKEITVMVDGTPCKYTVDVTYDLVVNDKVSYYEDNTESNAVPNNAPTGVVTIENDYIRLGVNLSYGGAITLLQSVDGGISENTENIINNYDWGRQIQMSMYSGPTPYYKLNHEEAPDRWKHLGWNPIQSGDVGEYHSRILAYYNDGECIYVKCRPMHWPQIDMPAECTYEVLYTLIDNSVDVRCRMVNQRTDYTDEEYQQLIDEYYSESTTIDSIRNTRQYAARSQELPAVYTNGNFCNLVAYTGTNPFEGEDLVTLFNASTPEEETESWRRYTATENWMALVDNSGYGLGIYNSATSEFSCGFVGPKADPSSCSETDLSTGYIGPKVNEILDYNIVYDYNYKLFVGTVEQIREGVYETAEIDYEDYSFDFSENRDGWYYPQNDEDEYITDSGFGNQNCLDFDFFPDSSLSSNKNFWRTDSFNSVDIDAAFSNTDGSDIRIDAVFTMYNGAQEADGVTAETITVPLIVKGDGERRTYTLELDDIYEYQNGLSCTTLKFNFLSSGSAEIYSISLK